jgi:cytochrome c-type biogenesis protein
MRLSQSPATAIPILFFTGVLTSLTPCIYPMIPITAAIVGGQSVGRSTRRGVVLTLLYALLGLLAGLTQTLFGTVSASPWAALVTGNLLLLFGLWMLDAIPIRIPSALLGGGRTESVTSLGGAFVMGCASGLVAAPCSAPVLAAVLTWVAVTKSAVLGFVYLFVFSIGMCALLVVVGIFGATFARLPRSGMWMVWIKRVLALVMIGAAEYYFVHAGLTM